MTSKVSLNLQEISPPYSSVLLLYKGDKKPPNKPCACAAWISTPSAPAVFTLKAASPNCLIITFNSSLVTERGASFAYYGPTLIGAIKLCVRGIGKAI